MYTSNPSVRAVVVPYAYRVKKKTTADFRLDQSVCPEFKKEQRTDLIEGLEHIQQEDLGTEPVSLPAVRVQLGDSHQHVVV
jgi:hypothetical protein